MYETCKKQYERKVARGALTHEYIEKQKVYLGIFLMNDMLTQAQYQELMDFLNEHDVEVKEEENIKE